MYNYADLFSGIGGFHLALNDAGIETKNTYFSDIEPYASQVYKKRFPNSKELGDITKIDEKTLGDIDIITGGFPCQDISVAGNQDGLEKDGDKTRSGLFYDLIRIAEEKQPKLMILENVRNILKIKDGKVMTEVLNELHRIGYNVDWEMISAASLGGKHLRERVWFVCHKMEKPVLTVVDSIPLPMTVKKAYPTRGSMINGDLYNKSALPLFDVKKSTYPTPRANDFKHSIYGSGSFYHRADRMYYAEWVARESGNTDPKCSVSAEFTENIMGYPENWTNLDKDLGRDADIENLWNEDPMTSVHKDRRKRLHALGNTIVPQCAKYILDILKIKNII